MIICIENEQPVIKETFSKKKREEESKSIVELNNSGNLDILDEESH
jgi:hypothetical protein